MFIGIFALRSKTANSICFSFPELPWLTWLSRIVVSLPRGIFVIFWPIRALTTHAFVVLWKQFPNWDRAYTKYKSRSVEIILVTSTPKICSTTKPVVLPDSQDRVVCLMNSHRPEVLFLMSRFKWCQMGPCHRIREEQKPGNQFCAQTTILFAYQYRLLLRRAPIMCVAMKCVII